MASVSPFRGIRYNPDLVSVGEVLAPPYDVISDVQRDALCARDPHNIVHIDYGRPQPDDRAGVHDPYTRAAQHLEDWLGGGVLVRDGEPSIYVSDHEFLGTDGSSRRRRGVYLTVPARPWEDAEVLPHERTLRGPKRDRLALMRATGTQTSAVWALWDRAPGVEDALDRAMRAPATLSGQVEGEQGPEGHRLWAVSDPAVIAAVAAGLATARLYIADGHHRYETAVAYAQERQESAAPAGALDRGRVLVYLCGADEPGLEILPTHRLVRPGAAVPTSLGQLRERLPGAARLDPAGSLQEAAHAAANGGAEAHRIAVQAPEGAALLVLPRSAAGSAREGLEVVALQDVVLREACGITPEGITEGALAYTRSLTEVRDSVRRGEAALGFGLRSCSTADLIAVSDAGETMPQKSTYFYPKVPTGLVLSPC